MNKLAIFSVPRSGSTWLGEIINSSPDVLYRFQPNFAYSFKLELNENSNSEEINNFFRHLEDCNDDFVNGRLSISSKTKEYHFRKHNPNKICFKETHFLNVIENLIQNSDIKVIGLVRSPFAVLNSWLKIPKEFDSKWSIVEEWQVANKKNEKKNTHFFGYNKWKESCFLFLKLRDEFPDKFHLINYQDLLEKTYYTVERLFQFCEISCSIQTQEFLSKSTEHQNPDAYSIFKKKEDDFSWRGVLPAFIEHKIKTDEEFIFLNNIFKWI